MFSLLLLSVFMQGMLRMSCSHALWANIGHIRILDLSAWGICRWLPPDCPAAVFDLALCTVHLRQACSCVRNRKFRNGEKERQKKISIVMFVTLYNLILAAVAMTTNKAAVFVWISYQSFRWGAESLACLLHRAVLLVASLCTDPEVRRVNKTPLGSG